MVARSVRWRAGKSRLPLTSRPSELSNRARISVAGSSFARAAASSIAERQPVQAIHDSRDRLAFWSFTVKPGTEAAARSANSRTDSHPATAAAVVPGPPSGTASGGTGNSCSPDTCSGERLVTRTRRRPVASSSSETNPPAASTCSKLSRTSRTSPSPI